MFFLIFIALAPIIFLINCDPLGDYLIEIRGVTYHEGYVGVQLTPAYGGLRLPNFRLYDSRENEIGLTKMHLIKDKALANYFLILEEEISLDSGWYTLKIEKNGFRFLLTDPLSEPNTIKLEVIL